MWKIDYKTDGLYCVEEVIIYPPEIKLFNEPISLVPSFKGVIESLFRTYKHDTNMQEWHDKVYLVETNGDFIQIDIMYLFLKFWPEEFI